MEPLMTVPELLRVLRISRTSLYKLLATDALPSYVIQGRRFFDPAEVRVFVRTQRQPLVQHR